MFWILRRTGAANFFNSLNNNCGTSKSHGSNAQTTQDKYVKRPPRKAYGRLSVDSDDASSAKHITDDPFEDIDNFAMISSANCNGKSKKTKASKTNEITREKLQNGSLSHSNSHPNEGDSGGGGSGSVSGCNGIDFSGNDSSCSGLNCCNGDLNNSCIDGGDHCKEADCQGNYSDNNLCQCNINNVCDGRTTMTETCNGNLKQNSSLCQLYSSKEIHENTINRLQAMAISDDDDYDEALTCNVCDRAFHCHRQLASHQQKKRHFGCGGCDSLFPSLMLLEHHKEEFEHWSDDEVTRRVCCRRNRGDDYFTDTDSFTSEAESEDLERLL